MREAWNFILFGIASIFIGGICGALYDLTTAEIMIYGALSWLIMNEFRKIVIAYNLKEVDKK